MAPSDSTPISLADFYTKEYHDRTRFTDSFLDGANLLRIQQLLTTTLRAQTAQPTLPVVGFSDAILGRLLRMANVYRDASADPATIQYANDTFVSNMMESLVARYYDTAFWKRWCHQGIPDPNNVPLPLAPERTDYTTESDSYTLADPWGGRRPQT